METKIKMQHYRIRMLIILIICIIGFDIGVLFLLTCIGSRLLTAAFYFYISSSYTVFLVTLSLYYCVAFLFIKISLLTNSACVSSQKPRTITTIEKIASFNNCFYSIDFHLNYSHTSSRIKRTLTTITNK